MKTIISYLFFIPKKENLRASQKKWLIHLLQEDFGLLGSSVFLGLIVSILGISTAVFSQKLIDVILPEKFFDTRKIGDLVARLNDTRRIQQVISVWLLSA